MTVRYTIVRLPLRTPPALNYPWDGTDTGGYAEVGLKFTLPAAADRLRWDRRGLWSVYPEDHIGREQGIAARHDDSAQPRWKDLDHDHYWNDAHWSISNGPRRETATNDFRSSKEYFRTAEVLMGGGDIGIQALSEEKDAIRLEAARADGPVTLIISNAWNYPTLGIGNRMRPPVLPEDGYGGTVYLRPVDLSE